MEIAGSKVKKVEEFAEEIRQYAEICRSKRIEIAKEKLRTDYLDAQIIYSIRLYCYGTLGRSREWLLHDNITPAETAVEMMFDSMPERLKDIFFE